MDARVVDAQLVVCCFPVTAAAQNYTNLAIVFSAKGNSRQEESSKASGAELAIFWMVLSNEIPQNQLIYQEKAL